MMHSPDRSSNIVFYEAPEKEEAPCRTDGFSLFTLINFAIAAVNVVSNVLNNNNNNNNNNNDRNNNDNNVNVADNNNNGNNLNMIDLGGALGRRRRILLEHPGDLERIRDSLEEEAIVLEVLGVQTADGGNRSVSLSATSAGRSKRDLLLKSWRSASTSDVTEQLAALFQLTSETAASLPGQHVLLMKHTMLLLLDIWEDLPGGHWMSADQKSELKNYILIGRNPKTLSI